MDLEDLEESLWLEELGVWQKCVISCVSHKPHYIVELCYNHVSWGRSNYVGCFFNETEAVLSLSNIQGISGNPRMGNLFQYKYKNINFSTKVKEKMEAMTVFLLQVCAIQLWKVLNRLATPGPNLAICSHIPCFRARSTGGKESLVVLAPVNVYFN